MKTNNRYLVVLREYERGWGSKDFTACEFSELEEATAYATSVNAENNLPVVPDYYITARVITNPAEFENYRSLL